MKMMKIKLVIIMLLLAGSAWLSGCEQKGPAERAGENVDQTLDNAGDNVEDAGEDMQEKANN